jgi:hypothetical protein
MPKQTRRKIEVLGHAYRWTVGGPGVIVWDEAGRQHQAALFDVAGIHWDTFERGHRKKTSDGMIRPGQVAAWIESHIAGTAARFTET